MTSCIELPDGFVLEHDVVPSEVWEAVKHWLSSDMLPPASAGEQGEGEEDGSQLIHVPIPWETGPQMQGRKIAQFGNCKYDYVTDVAVRCEPVENEIPEYIRQKLLSNQADSGRYTQCIINMYEASNEIPWHLDHEFFGSEVLVYTFGEERPLLLRKPAANEEHNRGDGDNLYIYSQGRPRHCSKYVLSGPARHVWEHSVPSGKGERVSITFRSWIGAK